MFFDEEIRTTPCVDPECVGGIIFIRNAYSSRSHADEEQECDICHGKGYLLVQDLVYN